MIASKKVSFWFMLPINFFNIFTILSRILLFVENNLDWKEPFYFVQAADTQFGLIRRWQYVEPGLKEGKKGWLDGPIKEWEKEKELSREAVKLVNALQPKPKFMIICGDMLDQFPYKIDERYVTFRLKFRLTFCVQCTLCYLKLNLFIRFVDGTMTTDLDPVRQAQYDDFVEIFGKLDVPLLCVCGNHDLGDKMNMLSVQRYETQWGDTYYKFYHQGVLYVVLNSQLLFDPNGCTALLEEQEKWLDETLKNEAGQFKHVIVFQHHPLFISTLDEQETYFNLPMASRKSLYEKLRAAGVKKVFTGHLHQNALGKHEDFECIVTSAIGLQLDNKGGEFF